uniref:Uncharacterized protein n=1 Tax=Amphimedon queenslandica TaxID=400682 RepID=A0A1X7V8I2_AMPQE
MDVGTVSSEQISMQEELVSATESLHRADMLKLSTGKFIVQLKEQHLATQACVAYTIESITTLLHTVLNVCESKLLDKLNGAGINCDPMIINEAFDGDHCHPFMNVLSAYQQKQFINNNLPYVEPIEISLGSHWITSTFSQTAEQLLTEHNSHDDCLRDICDGWQAKEHDRKEIVLEPLIADMKRLTNGQLFTVNRQSMRVFGSLLLFLADTLAAHQLGGYKGGVGFSLRKCRNCIATSEQMNKFFHHHFFLPRSPELHEYHCFLINQKCLSDFNSITYGVNYRSRLNDISLFHVANWQLPQDVMHILLEDVLPLELKLLLNFLISNNVFTLSHLNVRIMSFRYGHADMTTIPSTIDATHLSENGNFTKV